MLTPNGLRVGDYDLVYAGGTPDRLRALESGAVQGAMLTQPFEFAARRSGYPLLLDSTQYVTSLPFSAFAVTRTWLGNAINRAKAVRWLAAVYRGSQGLCDPSQKEAMIRILADETKLTDEDARLTYGLLLEDKHSVKCDLNLRPEELQQVIDYIVEMGDMAPPLPDPHRIADSSYLDQAIASLRR